MSPRYGSLRELMGVVGFLILVWALVIVGGDIIRQMF